jgi:hypothetical protein
MRTRGFCRALIILVFDLHVEIVATKKRRRQVEDSRQFARRDSVLGVVGHPRLQRASRGAANGAAAVDEALVHAACFRDVRVRRDAVAIRETECQFQAGIPDEVGTEF